MLPILITGDFILTRPYAFSFLGMAWGIGSITGPILGGLLSDPASQYHWFEDIQFFKDFKYFLPCFISSMLGFFSLIVTIIFLPETCKTIGFQFLFEAEEDLEIHDPRESLARQSSQSMLSPMPTTSGPFSPGFKAEGYSLGEVLQVLRTPSNVSNITETEIFWDAHSEGIDFNSNYESEPLVQNRESDHSLVGSSSLRAIFGYAMINLQAVVFEEFFALWALAPIGIGLNLNSKDMGFILSIMGGLNLVFQMLVFPRLAARYEIFALYKSNLLLYSFVWIALPTLAKLDQLGYTKGYFWIVLISILAVRRFAIVNTYTSINVLVRID
jgi:hypothetical protein